MKITIRDVAEAAGVSAMAVSKVLHGTGQNVRVSEEKAEKIRKVAREMHYQPNTLARSLRNRRTRMIGVVFQHFERLSQENPYYPLLLNGVMSALFPNDYTLALCPKLVQQSEEGAISDGRFDGVLWCRPDFSEASIESVRNSNIPVVMMHAPPGSAPGIQTFCADNASALRLVVNHFVELGHRHTAFVIDPVNEPTAEGRARAEAFLQSTASAGIEGEVIVWDGDPEELAVYATDDPPHTAFAAFSDTLAGRLLQACHRCGIRIPDDLSIVGFDSSSFCETTSPRLTSIYQPVERIAHEATTRLLALIEESLPESPADFNLSSIYDCRLDIRDSTSRPRFSLKR